MRHGPHVPESQEPASAFPDGSAERLAVEERGESRASRPVQRPLSEATEVALIASGLCAVVAHVNVGVAAFASEKVPSPAGVTVHADDGAGDPWSSPQWPVGVPIELPPSGGSSAARRRPLGDAIKVDLISGKRRGSTAAWPRHGRPPRRPSRRERRK